MTGALHSIAQKIKVPKIDRYLALEIMGPFAAALFFFFALLMAMQLLRNIEIMLGAAVRLVDLARVVGYLAPHFLVMAMPASYLFAVMLAVGRWSEDREIVALAASGVAPWRLWVAPVVLAFCVAGVGILLGRGPEPHGLAALKLYGNELIKRNMAGNVRPGEFNDNLRSIMLYTQGVSPKKSSFANVLLSDERDAEASLLVLAREGYVDPYGGGDTLQLKLRNGEIHRSSVDASDYALVTFQQATLNIGVGSDLLKSNRFGATNEELTHAELGVLAEQAEQKGRGEDARSLRLIQHKRLATPLATVAFALCGVPLAMGRRQRSRALGVMATLLAYVSYYVVARWSEVLAENGRMAPWLAAHVANLVMLGISMILVWRATRVEA